MIKVKSSKLSSLVQLSSIEQQALNEFIEWLIKQFGNLMSEVILFGSKARGDSKPDSDIDVLVIINSDDWQHHKQIRYFVADIYLKYNIDLSPRIWSLTHLQKMEIMQTSFYRHIKQDGINLFCSE